MNKDVLQMLGALSLLPQAQQDIIKAKSGEMREAIVTILKGIEDKDNKLLSLSLFAACLQKILEEAERG